LTERQKVSSGASQLQEWLLIAKSRARRDQQATGVRLLLDPNNPTQIRELQYIQQPDDFFVQPRGTDAQNQYRVRPLKIKSSLLNNINQNDQAELEFPAPLGAADFSGGLPNMSDWPVQIGDYLEVKGGGLVHRIIEVKPDKRTLLLQVNQQGKACPHPINLTEDYRIIRKPRVLTGEAALLLPKDIAIDISPRPAPPIWAAPLDSRETRTLSQGIPSTLDGTANIFSILFSPAGGVIGQGTTRDRIILFVRDVSLDAPSNPGEPFPGEPILISIDVRTGFISAHPVNPDGNFNDMYRFTRDGRGSGI
jgi:hypothetical protein